MPPDRSPGAAVPPCRTPGRHASRPEPRARSAEWPGARSRPPTRRVHQSRDRDRAGLRETPGWQGRATGPCSCPPVTRRSPVRPASPTMALHEGAATGRRALVHGLRGTTEPWPARQGHQRVSSGPNLVPDRQGWPSTPAMAVTRRPTRPTAADLVPDGQGRSTAADPWDPGTLDPCGPSPLRRPGTWGPSPLRTLTLRRPRATMGT